MKNALVFREVNKSYGEKKVLSGLDFKSHEGEFLVLLGPNGAGKSTSIALANGLATADSGSVEIFGHAAGGWNARRSMAYVPQEPIFPAHVRGIDLMKFSAAHSAAPRSIDELTSKLGLKNFVTTAVRHMSGGQKRLLSLACAFALNAPLVILDEPTTGLDLEMRRCVWDFLREYKQAGGSVLMTTHYLTEAETLAGRIVVLAAGKVAQDGTPDEIKRRFGYKSISFLSAATPPPALAAFEHEGRWQIDSRDPDKALRELMAWGQARDVDVEPLSLEDVFMRLIGREDT